MDHHLQKFLDTEADVVKTIQRSIYVDDIFAGANTPEKAYHLYEVPKDILRQGKFNLRKFITNSRPLQDKIDQREGSTEGDQAEETYTKSTLGNTQRMHPGEQKILYSM